MYGLDHGEREEKNILRAIYTSGHCCWFTGISGSLFTGTKSFGVDTSDLLAWKLNPGFIIVFRYNGK